MVRSEIVSKIREIISETTGLAPEEIEEQASFVDDLALDSLSLLQVVVDVDYELQLGFPEEEMLKVRTLGEAVDMVLAATSTPRVA